MVIFLGIVAAFCLTFYISIRPDLKQFERDRKEFEQQHSEE